MRARRHARVYRNGRAWSAGPSAVGGSKLRSVERDPCNDALQSSAISLSATGRAALYTRPKVCHMKRLLIALASSSCADLPSRSLCPPVIPAHAQIAREDIPGAPLLAVVGHARKVFLLNGQTTAQCLTRNGNILVIVLTNVLSAIGPCS